MSVRKNIFVLVLVLILPMKIFAGKPKLNLLQCAERLNKVNSSKLHEELYKTAGFNILTNSANEAFDVVQLVEIKILGNYDNKSLEEVLGLKVINTHSQYIDKVTGFVTQASIYASVGNVLNLTDHKDIIDIAPSPKKETLQ
jgi:hypothetical protein